jgi:hypothetical protein
MKTPRRLVLCCFVAIAILRVDASRADNPLAANCIPEAQLLGREGWESRPLRPRQPGEVCLEAAMRPHADDRLMFVRMPVGKEPLRDFLGLMERNREEFGVAAPQAELVAGPADPDRADERTLIQRIPGAPGIRVEADPPSRERAGVTFDGTLFHVSLLDNAPSVLARGRIAQAKAQAIARREADDAGDDGPRVTRTSLVARPRMGLLADRTPILVYRVTLTEASGKREVDVDAQTGAVVASDWTRGP